MNNEPEIIINGINVGNGCSMTIRVAIELFFSHLSEHGCGEDDHGNKLTQSYLARIDDIRNAMRINDTRS